MNGVDRGEGGADGSDEDIFEQTFFVWRQVCEPATHAGGIFMLAVEEATSLVCGLEPRKRGEWLGGGCLRESVWAGSDQG